MKTKLWIVGVIVSGISELSFFGSRAEAVPLTPQQAAVKIINKEIDGVVFDVNGVLLRRNRARSFKHIGLGKVISEFFKGNKFWDKEAMFRAMDVVQSDYNGEDLFHEDLVMPKIMADWQLGNVTGAVALQRCRDQLPEGAILPEILDLMFDPEILADVHDRNPPADFLLKTLGDKQVPTFVISNMDLATAHALTVKFPHLFHSMTDIVWSAAIHRVKPDPNIYLESLQQFNLEPARALFIDDELANRNGADEAGLFTLSEKGMKTLGKLLFNLDHS